MAKRRARSAKPKRPSPAPKVAASRIPPHPKPDDPAHEEWRIDEAEDESFRASDPSAPAQPHRTKRKN
jgi:hypothetical protein